MAVSATVTEDTQKNIWDGGVSPLKASYGKLMMWFFLLSDAFTFSGLLVTYGFLRYSYQAYEGPLNAFKPSQEYWPIPEKIFDAVPFLHGVDLPLLFVGIMTFVLILSSVTMDVTKWMLWTIVGGLTFLGCQAWEWNHFIHGTEEGLALSNGVVFHGANLQMNEYGPPLFASLFFFITGFHGTHVFSGVLLNTIIFYNVVVGTYQRRGHYEMVEKVGLYWHFVDLVWVFVFTFYYLI
jgi:cytochrome c oxidase subunit 3